MGSEQIKLTKNELRDQQHRLIQLEKYLPTLQLKKAMLQTEVNHALHEVELLTQSYQVEERKSLSFHPLLSDPDSNLIFDGAKIDKVEKSYDNIAGADIPCFEKVIFMPSDYTLFDSPLWVDQALESTRSLIVAKEKIKVAEEKKNILAKELKEVSIRVNLFEKVLIPRACANIKKIKVFLGDQDLSSVAQAKVAKEKIMKKKKEGEL